MKRRQPVLQLREDAELKEALAILISCTRNKKRPMSLTEISKWLDVAVQKLGSYSTVAERIGLSSKMLRQFSCVARLSGRVRAMFENRQLDSVDAAVHLAMMPIKEQEIVADALASGEIDTCDVRAAIQLLKVDKSLSIRDVLRRVKDTKTKHEYIAEFVVRGSRAPTNVLAAFKKHLPEDEIIRVDVDGVLGRLVLTKKGKYALSRAARKLGVPMRHVIPTILQY